MNRVAATQAHPVVTRSRLAATISRPLATIRPHVGRSSTPSSVKNVPTVSATLQARSSAKTYGVTATKRKVEPPRMATISTPKVAASARPMAAWPRTRTRTRQRSNEANRAVSIQATRMNGAVSLPSRLLVTARMGIRTRDGNSPK